MYSQRIYQEIYENGTFTVAAAGNGFGNLPWYYAFPASYDYVFSVTNIGYLNPYGSGAAGSVRGLHEWAIGDTINCTQHNSRVDLMAPGQHIGGLTYDPNNADPNKRLYTYDSQWGTSLSAPMVTGTAGLMISYYPCLSPYQIEYALKQSANDTVLTLPENLKYTGRLGAGLLNAGQTLTNLSLGINDNTSEFSCNAASTKTFMITGVEFNTLCAPGSSSNGVNPSLRPILKDGTPPYTYRWEYMTEFNHTTLSALDVAEPEIVSATGDKLAYYRLTVYDNSDIQKVASKYFRMKLSDVADYSLAMRDSYMDMLDEPNSMELFDNRDWDIWHSPDIWNRQYADGIEEHQTPEYSSNAPNHLYVKIRNVGCAPTSNGVKELHLYWTKASAGENWKYDWDGTTQVPSNNGGVVAAGGEITQNGLPTVPIIQPGAQVVLHKPWNPPMPQTYAGEPLDIEVCLLARVIDNVKPFTIPELMNTNVTPNMRNNKTIATKNTFVTNLTQDRPVRFLELWLANADNFSQAFNIEFITDRYINPQLAGDMSAVATITLHLGNFYDKWMRSGGKGTYIAIDSRAKTVTFDGSSPLRLEEITFEGKERFPIIVEVALKNGITIPDYSFLTHLRQFKVLEGKQDPSVYGNVNLEINTIAPISTQAEKYSNTMAISESGRYTLSPNPTSNRINLQAKQASSELVQLQVSDVLGMVVIPSYQSLLGNTTTIEIASLTPGVYFLHITDAKKQQEVIKFVKQ